MTVIESPEKGGQAKQSEWREQWSMLRDDELFLFQDWIYPFTLEDFRGKTVLECGCGGGQHTSFMAPYADKITAVDLNTTALARERNRAATNVEFVEADIGAMDLGRRFDVAISIGVVHHTDNPDKTVANMIRHLKPGGRLILWVYSWEGNFLVRAIVEPIRKTFLVNMSRASLLTLSKAVTAAVYLPVYTLYLLPLRFLPYYEYFENFRRLSFERNTLNVFDKLNAPQVDFIREERIRKWLDASMFADVSVTPYKAVSWRGSGTLR